MQLFKATLETGIMGFATYGGQLYWTTKNDNISTGDQLLTTVTELSNLPPHQHFVNVVADGTLAMLNATTSIAGTPSHSHTVINGVVMPILGSFAHDHGLNGSSSGKVFQYDPATGQTTIVYADSDYALTAISSTSPNDTTGTLFVGSSPHGRIMRYVSADNIFVRSFATPGRTVYELRYLNSTMFAVVDSTVYYWNTVWYFDCSTSAIHDVAAESPSVAGSTDIFTLGDTSISATSTSPASTNSSLCCYVRFQDAAGNISAVTDANGNIIPCYAPCVNLSSGASGVSGFSGAAGFFTDKLMEIDESANTVWELAGATPFLSGNLVQQEIGQYISETLNGTTDLVQWSSISWDATTPAGTSITIAIRSADSVSDIENALWSDEYSNPGTYGPPVDLTNQTGHYLPFRATLTAYEVGVASPALNVVMIALQTSQATHYFTTNFVLPDNILNGIIAANLCVNAPQTDVVFGINSSNSSDFSDYAIVPLNQVFSLPSEAQAQNLRVGIKLISSPTSVPIVDEFALAFSLANDAIIRLNLLPPPIPPSGQLAPGGGTTRTVISEIVQNHSHSITFAATILDKFNINGQTSINAAHQHSIVSGSLQISAGHIHSFSI